jgi:hypothetical protein
MRAMHTPLGMTLLGIGVFLGFLLLVSAHAALSALTLFLVRRSRGSPPTLAECPGACRGERYAPGQPQ